MIRMTVLGSDAHSIYRLRDKNSVDYLYRLEFRDVPEAPKKGDYIFWDERYCTDKNERYSSLVFGMGQQGSVHCGDEVTELDFIIVVRKDFSYMLHRYYE